MRAKPGVTVLYWAVGNGTTVAPGEVINEQWTLTVVTYFSYLYTIVCFNLRHVYEKLGRILNYNHVLGSW